MTELDQDVGGLTPTAQSQEPRRPYRSPVLTRLGSANSGELPTNDIATKARLNNPTMPIYRAFRARTLLRAHPSNGIFQDLQR